MNIKQICKKDEADLILSYSENKKDNELYFNKIMVMMLRKLRKRRILMK
jgi:hypothetical protein